ncbi:MAG: ATP-binding cassette domain-containing protein [Thermoplasmatales archaeon]
MSDSGTILELRNISKVFSLKSSFLKSHEFKALDGVNLKLGKGEIMGLVGGSGSGKTTIARILTMLYSPTSGNIIFEGNDVTNISGKKLRKYRQKVQMIFQDPYSSLDPSHSVYWHVERPLKLISYEGNIEERIMQLLSVVKLDPPEQFYDRLPYQLSGGQRQRVYMARALAMEPSLLIADEPVSNLDASVKASILGTLKEIREKFNLSILYISHDIATVWYICDKVAVINKGRIVEEGLSNDVVENPHDEYTKLLINSAPDPFKRLE